MINKLRKNSRLIKCNNTYIKNVYKLKNKINDGKKYKLKVTNDCVLITNLMDNEKFSDECVLNLYRERWSVEIFFKFMKNNFKFQHMAEKNSSSYKKMYICELILIYISKILIFFNTTQSNEHTKIKKKDGKIANCKFKINETNLMSGIFEELLYSIISGNLKQEQIRSFCKSYIHIIKNELNRSFPRYSKTPFTKWYIKQYSIFAEILKIINAIENNTLHKLNDNLKSKAKNIKIID